MTGVGCGVKYRFLGTACCEALCVVLNGSGNDVHVVVIVRNEDS